MKYAVVDNEGRAMGFYSDDVSTDIPTDAIPITDAIWRQWSENETNLRYKNGRLVPHIPTAAERRDQEIDAAASRIEKLNMKIGVSVAELIDVLIAKGLIAETDLPTDVQKDMATRRTLKSTLASLKSSNSGNK